MRFINLIVVHCSATRCDRCYTEHDLTTDHLRRGFSGAGYHFYIRKNGDIKSLRPLSLPGAHVRGWNAGSIGVCYEGGLDECGRPADILYSKSPVCTVLSGYTNPSIQKLPS